MIWGGLEKEGSQIETLRSRILERLQGVGDSSGEANFRGDNCWGEEALKENKFLVKVDFEGGGSENDDFVKTGSRGTVAGKADWGRSF